VITKSILIDLIGGKVWSSISFTSVHTTDESVQPLIEFYFSKHQDGSFKDGIEFRMDTGRSSYLHSIDARTLLAVFSEGASMDAGLGLQVAELVRNLKTTVGRSGAREASKLFPQMAGKTLRQEVRLCFVSSETPTEGNKPGIALESLLSYTGTSSTNLSKAVAIGPYNVRVQRISINDVLEGPMEALLADPQGFIVILGKPLPDRATAERTIGAILKLGTAPVLIAPGSDDELEAARKYENDFRIELCDAVSERPSYLLLAVLAMLGLSDMHPEFAEDSWPIEEALDESVEARPIIKKEVASGHQAFFVVDKSNGEAVFTYYYRPQSEVYERAPNVVAAITSFSLDTSEPNKTSVVQVGDLIYALIEVDKLIFTLVTGPTDDVEAIRQRFSFLPDLWKDEEPEFLMSTDDPYSSPPFTLKLLATLPPEELLPRMQPHRKKEPEWDRFESPEVRDFLRAVWNSLDGKIEMSRFLSGAGPQMTLGAIHFLKAMGCVEMAIQLTKTDSPKLINEIPDDIRILYAEIEDVADLMDGLHTIGRISNETDIPANVLTTVISRLYALGVVDFKD
jgi:hypothetical protein